MNEDILSDYDQAILGLLQVKEFMRQLMAENAELRVEAAIASAMENTSEPAAIDSSPAAHPGDAAV